MSSQADVEFWLLEYACRFHHHQVIEAVCDRHGGTLLDSGVPTLNLALPALSAIITEERLDQFDLAVRLVDAVHAEAADVVPFRLAARLSSALKVKSLFHQLFSGQDCILEKLNNYFPRSGLHCPSASKKTLSQLNASQSEFRRFFLPLLANERQRKAYLRDEYTDEFGPEFMAHCKKLTQQFVSAIEGHLPPTTLEKLMSVMANGVDVEGKLQEAGAQSPWTEMVLDAVTGQRHLTTKTLLDLLTMVSPVDSHDRVVGLPRSLPLLTDIGDSEDSGTDQTPPTGEGCFLGEVTKGLISTSPDFVPEDSGRKEKITVFNDLSSNKMSAANNTAVSLCVKEKLPPCLGGCGKEVMYEGHASVRAGDLPPSSVSAAHLTATNADEEKNLASSCSVHICKISEHQPERSWCDICVKSNTSTTPIRSDLIFHPEKTSKSGQHPPLRHKQTGEKQRQEISPVRRKCVRHADENTNSGHVSERSLETPTPKLCAQDDSPSACRKRKRQDTSPRLGKDQRKLRSTKSPVYRDESLSDSDVMIMLSQEDSSDETWQRSQDSSGSLGSISNIDRSTTDSERDSLSGSGHVDHQPVESSCTGELSSSQETGLTERDIYTQLISPYRKCPLLRLCVVKLFKNKRWKVTDGEEELDIYS